MATPDKNATDGATNHTKIEFGEFPFPLSDGPDESRYLTWLRNHSNYMAVRGGLDYLRSVGVLVRGIIVNFLIFLPYLLIVSIVLAYFHHPMLGNPFRVTLWVLVFAVAWILLFPILMPLFNIFSYKRSVEVGSESSVRQRDLYERSFGALLAVILAMACLESMPWVLELLHDLIGNMHFGWQEGFAAVAAALALLSGSDKLLSVLSGAKRSLAMVLIGILGLLVPLLVILYATDFLLYSPPPGPTAMYSPLVVPIVGVIAIVIAIPLGLWRNAFSLKECAGVVGMLVAGLILVAVVIMGVNSAISVREEKIQEIGKIIDPLEQVAKPFDEISNKNEMNAEVATLVDELVIVKREYEITGKDAWKEFELLWGNQDRRCFSPKDGNDKGDKTWLYGLQCFFDKWMFASKVAELEGRFITSGQQFITWGDKLSAQPRGSLEPLRREITKLAYDELLEEIERLASEKKRAGGFTKLMHRYLLERHLALELSNLAFERSRRGFDTKSSSPTNSDKPPDENIANFEQEVTRVRDSFDSLRKELKPVNFINTARFNLQRSTVEKIAQLVTEAELFEKVKEKFKEASDKAQLARLAGKDELVKLLNKDELVNLVLPRELSAGGPEFRQLVRTKLIEMALLNKDLEGKAPISKPVVAVKLAVLVGSQKPSSDSHMVDSSTAQAPEGPPAEQKGDGEDPNAELAPVAEPPEVRNKQLGDLEPAKVIKTEIAKLAREKLAQLALADFDVSHLLAVLRYERESVSEGKDSEPADLAKHIPLQDLAQNRAFPPHTLSRPPPHRPTWAAALPRCLSRS